MPVVSVCAHVHTLNERLTASVVCSLWQCSNWLQQAVLPAGKHSKKRVVCFTVAKSRQSFKAGFPAAKRSNKSTHLSDFPQVH